MKQYRSYSAISYVAAALIALSGPIAAAPADVSGAIDQQLPQTAETGKRGAYFALKEHPPAAQPIRMKPIKVSADRWNRPTLYDAGAIDELQEKLDAELDALIELRGL